MGFSYHVADELDLGLAVVKDAASSSISATSRNDALDAWSPFDVHTRNQNASFVAQSTTNRSTPLAQTEGVHIAIANDPRVSADMTPCQSIPIDVPAPRRESTRPRQTMCNSGLAQQLSHKLSVNFGNPTIVHRPHMRTRPTLLSMHEDIPQGINLSNELLPSPQQSTAPSSYNASGSISVGDPSTAKTSLESNVMSLRSVKELDLKEKSVATSTMASAEDIMREKPLTPIQEAPPIITPTIVTVELTASAKIFFETYFNSLLAGHASPRSIRRHALESHFEAQSLSEEQRKHERAIWAAYETEHLRQTRVLQSKTNEMNKGSGVAIAGYEVVRILGKGSFGVVRLVRERDVQPYAPSNGSLASSIPGRKAAPREEFSNFKATAIEALKATFDGQKPSQRRILKKTKREVYALKVIRKSDMLRNCQEGHLRAERDFLVASENSRWVVPLVASFQDNTNLYLVMDYMVGGDFLGLLFRKDILKERHARWYIAEMILCVEEAHKLRWIHRDVKPDNFLISASGHLKISDFGLAFDGHWAHDQRYFRDHRQSLMEKLGIEVIGDAQDREDDAQREVQANLADILTGQTWHHHKAHADRPSENESILQWRNRHGKRRLAGSVVGTSQYMAPEVIRGDPYDGRCDWWSIGIILFEVSRRPQVSMAIAY